MWRCDPAIEEQIIEAPAPTTQPAPQVIVGYVPVSQPTVVEYVPVPVVQVPTPIVANDVTQKGTGSSKDIQYGDPPSKHVIR